MCQSKAQGGKRCDHDTSENRRLRRKAAKLRVTSPAVSTGPIAPQPLTAGLVSPSIARLKQEAEQLRADMLNAPTDPVKRSAYDARMEVRLTKLGMSIGEEADKIADVKSLEEINELVEAYDNKLFGPLNEERDKNDEIRMKHRDQWWEIRENIIGFGTEFPTPDDLEDVEDEEDRRISLLMIENHHKLLDLNKRQSEAYKESTAYQGAFYMENRNKLADAYRTIISQIRPVGGNIGWNESSDTEVGQILQESVGKDYPSSWLQMHNDNKPEEVVLGTESRPGYTHELFSDTEEDGISKPAIQNQHVAVSGAFNTDEVVSSLKSLDNVSIKSYVSKHYNRESKQEEVTNGFVFIGPDYEAYDPNTHGELLNDKPEGEGWEYTTSITTMVTASSLASSPESLVEKLQQKSWMRPISTTKKVNPHLSLFPEESRSLLADMHDESSFEEVNRATAYHEFAHRIESIYPDNLFARQEKAFLKRRANKTDENMYSDMKTINYQEIAHEGNFIIKYTGRDYLSSNNYEVFTTGIESLYGKNYGGLTGNSKTYGRKDLDHRGFTLGALATL
jgi:hypothetical protein